MTLNHKLNATWHTTHAQVTIVFFGHSFQRVMKPAYMNNLHCLCIACLLLNFGLHCLITRKRCKSMGYKYGGGMYFCSSGKKIVQFTAPPLYSLLGSVLKQDQSCSPG